MHVHVICPPKYDRVVSLVLGVCSHYIIAPVPVTLPWRIYVTLAFTEPQQTTRNRESRAQFV